MVVYEQHTQPWSGAETATELCTRCKCRRIVRCRRRAPSIFQLPWKFRSWETRFASVHTLNNVAVQPRPRHRCSPFFPPLFLSKEESRGGGEERNKNKKMVSVISEIVFLSISSPLYRTLVTGSSKSSYFDRSEKQVLHLVRLYA